MPKGVYVRSREWKETQAEQLRVSFRAKAVERFWSSIDKQSDGCWLWTGPTSKDGYGHFWFENRQWRAHCFAWELLKGGPISENLQLDHLCRVRHCVNPDHLEPVTCRKNLLRGETLAAQNAVKTHCPQGHAFEGDNLYVSGRGDRQCRICRRDASRRSREKKAQVQFA